MTDKTTKSLAVIDSQLDDYQALVEAAEADNMQIVLLSGNDGIDELAEVLENYDDIDALHLFTHGSQGQVQIGDDNLSSATLDDYAEELELIKGSLSEDGDILLYGCNVAEGDTGEDFIEQLALVTGADIAASDDLTGNSELGGDWELEESSAEIETQTLSVLGFSNTLAWQDFDPNNGAFNASFGLGGPLYDGKNAFKVSSKEANVTFFYSNNDASGHYYAFYNHKTGNAGTSTLYVEAYGIASFDISNLEISLLENNGGTVSTMNFTGYLSAGGTATTAISSSWTFGVWGYGEATSKGADFSSFNDITKLKVEFTTSTDINNQQNVALGGMDISDIKLIGSNSAPSQSSNTGSSLIEGGTDTIANTELAFTDDSDGAANITYTITTNTSNGTLKNNGSDLAQNDTFTQADIDSGLITYVHDGDETTSDSFGFKVADSEAAETTGQTFNFTIAAQNDAPTVATNDGLTVNEGAAGTIANTLLNTTDPDDSATGLTYTITSGTANGSVWVDADGNGSIDNGESALAINGTFTQQDIDDGKIKYLHHGSETISDSFGFSVEDGLEDSVSAITGQTFSITVTPQNDAPILGGNPADDTATEDVATAIDLSAYNISDAELDDPITLTLSVDRGTIAALGGNGTASGVTVAGSGTNSMTLAGGEADLNIFLDNTSNILFTTDANDTTAATLTVTPNDGTTNGTADTVTINITAVNDAPGLDAVPSPVLTTIDEDAGDDDGSAADGDDDGSKNANNPGTSVAALVVNGSITDVDGGAVEAIAVTQVDNTNGVWQYSTDNGSSWNNFSGTTGSSVDLTATARLLDGSLSGASTQLVRFVPDANYSGTATITFHAWDKSAGSSGGTADASTTGNATPFSTTSDTASVTINAVNDAPVFSGLDGTPSYTEGAAAVQLDANATISDLEMDALNGGNGDYSGASLTIARNGGADASDSFGFDTAGASFTVSGGNLQSGGNTFATFTNAGGTLTVNFTSSGTTATSALADEVLQRITYENTSNDQTSNPQLDWTFSDGAANGTGSITATLTDVNDAPSVTATGGNPTFIEGGAAQDLYNTVTADTVETGQTFTAMTLTVTNVANEASEILSFDGSDVALTHNNTVTPTATNGLTVGVSVTGSTATVSFSGATLSEAQLQTLVDGLTYRNESQDPTTAGNRVVTITSVTDSGGGTNSATPNLTSTASLTGVNDAPVVSNVYTETSQVVAGNGAQGLSGFADAAVTNIDSADYNGGFVTLAQTSGTANGNWFVDGTTVTSGGDATVSAGETILVSGTSIGTVDVTDDGQGVNDFTINFGANASNSAVQTLLHNLQYDAPSALGDRGFTLTLNDADGIANGGDADDSGSFTISVTPNPPVIGNLDSDSVNASEGGGTVLLDAGSNATLTDADSVDLNGGTVTVSVTNNADAASDVLSVDTSGVVSLAGTTAGSNISVSGSVIGTLGNNIAAGNDFIVNLSALSTPALVQSLLQALTFEATGENPAESTRTVSITVSDGQANDAVDVSVAVTAVNDAPQLAGLITDASFTEDTAANLDLSASTLSDVDTTGSVTLTLTASAGSLSASSGGGVTVGGSTTTALTLTGTIADIDTFLNGANITHAPGENLAGNDAATVSLSINDGGTDTDLGSVNIDITPVNDAPTAADDTVNISYNGTHTFTAADFGFSDVDTGDSLQSVRIDTVPAAGILTLNGNAVSNGDVISSADINATLLQFSPSSGESGSGYATLQFTVNDGTVFADASNTLTFDVAAAPPPPPPTPEPEPEPEPAPDLIDGATVDESSTTENGQQVAKVTISPITSDREDTDSNTSLADIPLHFDENDEPVTTLSLPVGIGATARTNETATDQTSFRDGLYLLRDSAPASDWFSMINGMDQWLNGIGAGWLNQVTFTSNSSEAPSEPIKVSGVEGDKTEVMVIDASQLPAGTVIDIDNIEFAIIVGDVQVRGGSGSNVVFAGSGNQNIVLGADDDELHGGGGDDTVGSEGGDDLLFGEDGNDTLFGGTGKDQLHGGMDNDIATYEGNFADYRVEQLHGVVTITHLDDDTDVDTLINIEQIQFADQTWTPVYGTDLSIIATLYQQVLDRQADLGGFQYWSDTADSRSKGQIALEFLTSDEYQQENSFAFEQLSLAEQIEQLYQGLLGRSSDLGGKEYWTEQLAEGMDLSQVAESFVYSDELNGQLKASNSWDFFL